MRSKTMQEKQLLRHSSAVSSRAKMTLHACPQNALLQNATFKHRMVGKLEAHRTRHPLARRCPASHRRSATRWERRKGRERVKVSSWYTLEQRQRSVYMDRRNLRQANCMSCPPQYQHSILHSGNCRASAKEVMQQTTEKDPQPEEVSSAHKRNRVWFNRWVCAKIAVSPKPMVS